MTIIPLFAVAMILMPVATKAPFWVFLIVMIIWSALSWSPAQQNYLIQTAPKTADIQLSINNSACHIGVGGVVIEKSSIIYIHGLEYCLFWQLHYVRSILLQGLQLLYRKKQYMNDCDFKRIVNKKKCKKRWLQNLTGFLEPFYFKMKTSVM
ncbi:MFS transporter [Paenisporosarcina sp. OV554]|uniref:MFS transporter n=1 Tax=Paenisporosarcina sp. OV554 TaxID=2135694 RepID=UPI000D3900BD|nr:MFS transporter [Paenisporosarcina sp. OV554]PUB08325.1 hypothetical protein C8K15_1355 [Paenisporosarcina sp. OV554]